jgi:hypothetical protein
MKGAGPDAGCKFAMLKIAAKLVFILELYYILIRPGEICGQTRSDSLQGDDAFQVSARSSSTKNPLSR